MKVKCLWCKWASWGCGHLRLLPLKTSISNFWSPSKILRSKVLKHQNLFNSLWSTVSRMYFWCIVLNGEVQKSHLLSCKHLLINEVEVITECVCHKMAQPSSLLPDYGAWPNTCFVSQSASQRSGTRVGLQSFLERCIL